MAKQVADRNVEPDPVVAPPCFQHQHARTRLRRQAVGQHAAGRTCAHDDVVELTLQTRGHFDVIARSCGRMMRSADRVSNDEQERSGRLAVRHPLRMTCDIAALPGAPRHFLAAEDVLDRPRARVVVEQGHAQQQVGFAGILGDELRASERAEVAVLAGRGLVEARPVLAAQPTEILARQRGGDVERRSMRLAAAAARAEADAQPPAGSSASKATAPHRQLPFIAASVALTVEIRPCRTARPARTISEIRERSHAIQAYFGR